MENCNGARCDLTTGFCKALTIQTRNMAIDRAKIGGLLMIVLTTPDRTPKLDLLLFSSRVKNLQLKPFE